MNEEALGLLIFKERLAKTSVQTELMLKDPSRRRATSDGTFSHAFIHTFLTRFKYRERSMCTLTMCNVHTCISIRSNVSQQCKYVRDRCSTQRKDTHSMNAIANVHVILRIRPGCQYLSISST